MKYDRGDSFLLDFKPSGIPFGSKFKGKLSPLVGFPLDFETNRIPFGIPKLSPRSYPIEYEQKWNTSFLSVHLMHLIIKTEGC